MNLYPEILFILLGFSKSSQGASSSPTDRQTSLTDYFTSSFNAQASSTDLSGSGYYGFFTNTYNYVMETGYSISDKWTNRIERLDKLKIQEKGYFEERPRNEFTDYANCPAAAFPEPGEWDVERIKEISATLASISDFEPKGADIVELKVKKGSHKTTYLFYQSGKDFELFALRPVIYPNVAECTPERAIKYHLFINDLLGLVSEKIGKIPKRQIVFAGAGEAGAMALILAWRIYINNEYLVACGESNNTLNQINVITFDTRAIVTENRMETCPLSRHNMLNFMSQKALEQVGSHRGFVIGGYIISVDSSINFKHSAKYNKNDITDYISYPKEWEEKIKTNQTMAEELAEKFIADHHAITKHHSQNAWAAFKDFALETILVRDHDWCATEMIKNLSLSMGLSENVISFEIVKDQSNRLKKSPREVRFKLKTSNKINIAIFSVEILKDDEKPQTVVKPLPEISEMKISEQKKAKLLKWNKCINDLFSMSQNYKSFSPLTYGKATEPLEFTIGKFPAQCSFINLNTSFHSKTAYTTNPEAFLSMFGEVWHRKKPQSCEGQLHPPKLTKEERGNRDIWLTMFKNFWSDAMNLVGTHKRPDSLQALGNIKNIGNYELEVISGPQGYMFPWSFNNLMEEINNCISNNDGSSMINCRKPASLFSGVNHWSKRNKCPFACYYEGDNTAGCESVLPCREPGIFIFMRGDSKVEFDIPLYKNETKERYMSSIPCGEYHGRTFHFSIKDTSPGLPYISGIPYIQTKMFTTICFDPIRVPFLLKTEDLSQPNINFPNTEGPRDTELNIEEFDFENLESESEDEEPTIPELGNSSPKDSRVEQKVVETKDFPLIVKNPSAPGMVQKIFTIVPMEEYSNAPKASSHHFHSDVKQTVIPKSSSDTLI
jgi:hypothetical protein